MKEILFEDIASIMTMKSAHLKEGRTIVESDLSIIKDACLVVDGGKIKWIGKKSQLPKTYFKITKKSLNGFNVYPGFIDCHTHLIFAGDRTPEFEMRNKGISYQEIARQGGGILSTVMQTRKASTVKLLELAQERVNECLSQGVTTVEIKSGYGLNQKSEEKILQVANKLKKINVITTYLGAHAIPKEFKNEDDYLKQLKDDLKIIKAKNLSQRVDIFIEKNYFSKEKAKDYLEFAKSLGFSVTIHADQLTRSEATLLAIELKAQSADHVICINDNDKKKLASSETTAVLLPAADFYLQCQYPDARKLIDLGARVALASDFNPGTCPTQNIQFVGLLARLQMKMTLPEVFSSLTVGAAYALGLQKQKGALNTNMAADFFVSKNKWNEFFYDLSNIEIHSTFIEGKKVY
jgi:imidazolonepropionase